MKVYECINQLTELTNTYNTIDTLNSNFFEITKNINKNDIKRFELSQLIDYIEDSLPNLSYDLVEEIYKCFDNIDEDILKSIKDKLTIAEQEVNDIKRTLTVKDDGTFKFLFPKFMGYEFIDVFSTIKSILHRLLTSNNTFKFICLYMHLLNNYVSYESYDTSEFNAIFNVCIEAKNKLCEYALSLEVPTKKDLELEED